jgi:hypothetical protein
MSSPASSAARSSELSAPWVAESSTIRNRKPRGPLPWGSTTTMSKRWSPSKSAGVVPWTDEALGLHRSDARGGSVARQLPANIHSATSAKAPLPDIANLPATEGPSTQTWRSERILQDPVIFI